MTAETVTNNPSPETTGVMEPISAKDIIFGHDDPFPMDEAVIEGNETNHEHKSCADRREVWLTLVPFNALPEGTRIVSAVHFGTSSWTVTGKVTARDPDGTEKLYFLKVWPLHHLSHLGAANDLDCGIHTSWL